MKLTVAEYAAELAFTRPGRMTHHPGTTLRGGLGKALRDISCVIETGDCQSCILQSRCVYGFLFETPITPEADVLRRYTRAPHPMVLRPPLQTSPTVEVGQVMEVVLVLVGRGADYLPYLVLALQRLGQMGLGPERIGFELRRVAALPGGEVVYDAAEPGPVLVREPAPVTAAMGESREGRFALHFRTPLRLRVQERVVRAPEFAPLVSAALRRLELLCRTHDEGRFDLDAAALAARARSVRRVTDDTAWHDLSRFSRRQDRSMPMGGLIGSATFEGDIGTFGEILDLAGRVHVGKHTSFGHGHFVVEEADAHA